MPLSASRQGVSWVTQTMGESGSAGQSYECDRRCDSDVVLTSDLLPDVLAWSQEDEWSAGSFIISTIRWFVCELCFVDALFMFIYLLNPGLSQEFAYGTWFNNSGIKNQGETF